MSAACLFIEAIGFTGVIKEYFASDEAYSQFQTYLASEPEKGAVIPGAGPLRKLRWGDKARGMGKRGGLRVIYVHVPEVSVLYLLDVFGKNEADDLTKGEKAELQKLALELIQELRERYKKR